jgi:hypothetical protein
LHDHVVSLSGSWTANVTRLFFIEHSTLVSEVDEAGSVTSLQGCAIRLHDYASLHHVPVLTRTVRVGRHHGHVASSHGFTASASLHLKSTHKILRAVDRSTTRIACCNGCTRAMVARRCILLRARLNFSSVIGRRALTCVPALLLWTVADHNRHADSLHTTAVFLAGCVDEL